MNLKRELEHIKSLFESVDADVGSKIEDEIEALKIKITTYDGIINKHKADLEALKSVPGTPPETIVQMENVLKIFTTEKETAQKKLAELQVKLAREKLTPEIEQKFKDCIFKIFEEHKDILGNLSSIIIKPTMPTPTIEIRMRKARGREITFLLSGKLPEYDTKNKVWTLRPVKISIKGGSATIRFILNLHNVLVAFLRRKRIGKEVINYLNTIKDKTHIAEIKHQDWIRDLSRTDIGIKGTIAYKISQYLPEDWKIENFYEEPDIDDATRLTLNQYDPTSPEIKKLLDDIGYEETVSYLRYGEEDTGEFIDEEDTIELEFTDKDTNEEGIEYITL